LSELTAKRTPHDEYKNAKVSRVEPDGIVLMIKSGISVKFILLNCLKRFRDASITIQPRPLNLPLKQLRKQTCFLNSEPKKRKSELKKERDIGVSMQRLLRRRVPPLLIDLAMDTVKLRKILRLNRAFKAAPSSCGTGEFPTGLRACA
jgi:hypothetical protein